MPTALKDIVEYEKSAQLDKIMSRLEDTSKYDIDRLSADYQEKLRLFMDASRKLHQKLGKNWKEEALKVFDIQMNTKKILEKNAQITSVVYDM